MTFQTNDAKTREKLRLYLAEIKARGIPIPAEIRDELIGVKKAINFPINKWGCFNNREGKPFIPNPKQEQFIFSDARFAAAFAGRGSGKSAMGSQKAGRKIAEGWSGAVLNPDFENFKISTWPEFREWIPWDLVTPKHKHRANPSWVPNQPFQLVFNNGAVVICKGLKDADSARGPNINWLWYDEAGRDETGEAWQIAVASVRVGENPQAWVTTTPRGKDHWCYRFFVEQDIPEEAVAAFNEISGGKALVETIYTTIDDNKDHLDPGFYAQLLAAYPAGWLRQQELYGEFVDYGGVLGNRAWFDGKIVPYPPAGVRGRVRYWDLAASERKIASGKKTNDPDETCGTLMSFIHDPIHNTFFIEDQVSGFWQWEDIKRNILEIAIKDGPAVKIYIEQEPGSGGINQVAELAKIIRTELPSWQNVEPHNPRDLGDKIMRANTWFAEANRGEIFLVAGLWIEPFLTQLSSFPIGRHDDKIDSVSGARHTLAPVKRWKSIGFLKV